MPAVVFRFRLALFLGAALIELAWWSSMKATRTLSTSRPTSLLTTRVQRAHFHDDVNNDTSIVKQYVRYNKRGTKQVMKAIHSVHRDDLTDLDDDDLFRSPRTGNRVDTTGSEIVKNDAMRRSKQEVLNVLRDAGVTEVDDETVALLPTWNNLVDMYGSVSAQDPLYIGGEETCQRFRQTVPQHEAFLGTAGFYNSGTNALTYYMRANLRMSDRDAQKKAASSDSKGEPSLRLHDGILTQVPWDKHYFASLKRSHTVENAQSFNKDHVLPIVIIRDPLTWWHSMCATPYGVKFAHTHPAPKSTNITTEPTSHNKAAAVSAMCRKLTVSTSDTENSVSLPTMTGKKTWSTILHLWNDWYRSYLLEYKYPFLMVRFEDLLFRPRVVLQAIRDCANATWIDESAFTYVVDHSKWEHVRFHGPQSTMLSAMIKHGCKARRVQGLSTADLHQARKILDPTLLRQFGYRIPASGAS